MLARAATIRCYRLGGLDNRTLLSYSCGGWKLDIKVSAELAASEASVLGWWMAILPLCLHVVSPLCVSNLFFL